MIVITPDTSFKELDEMLDKMGVTMFVRQWGSKFYVTVADLKTRVAIEAIHENVYVAATAALRRSLN